MSAIDPTIAEVAGMLEERAWYAHSRAVDHPYRSDGTPGEFAGCNAERCVSAREMVEWLRGKKVDAHDHYISGLHDPGLVVCSDGICKPLYAFAPEEKRDA